MTPRPTKNRKITPEEYLLLALDETLNSRCDDMCEVTVDGDVNIPADSPVKRLPKAVIRGSLSAEGCKSLERVDCRIVKDADFSGSGVSEFGLDFSVGRRLRSRNCPNLKTLVGVFNFVDLSGSGVTELANSFSCSGDLRVDKCLSLETLDCEVSGDVVAGGSSVSKLGGAFRCSGDINFGGCMRLKEIGDIGSPSNVNLSKSGVEIVTAAFQCRSNLQIHDSEHVKSISGAVGGAVNVWRCPSLATARGLQVSGNAFFEDCPRLKEVDVRAKGSAAFNKCGFERLSPTCSSNEELSVVNCKNMVELGGSWGKDVSLVDLPALREITPDFKCEGDLTVRSCGDLEKMAGDIKGYATMQGLGALKVLDKYFRVGRNLHFEASGSVVRKIGCRVGRNMTVVGPCRLSETLSTMDVGGDAVFKRCDVLAIVRGAVGGCLTLEDSTGLKKLGADLDCDKNVAISGALHVEIMNCRIGKNLSLDRVRVDKMGPAFTCTGDISLKDSKIPSEIPEQSGGSPKVPFLPPASIKGTSNLSKSSAKRQVQKDGSGRTI